ncbi:hypothetical protein WM16_08860 [Burkholderia ubonensis]|uniref:Uncharacterized protein n=1 Tax=Burkholderia ubonensis TaxID=101571 RepID=A0A108CRJ6_9BURK|nr:hypothetical protein WM16_08860 [Burkholderia ubonensis]
MASLFDDAKRFVSNLRDVSGRQTYFLDVPGTDTAAALSVVSVFATERMGAPTEVRVVLTHPLQLARTEYLNHDAACTIVPDDGVPRRFIARILAQCEGHPRRYSHLTSGLSEADWQRIATDLSSPSV